MEEEDRRERLRSILDQAKPADSGRPVIIKGNGNVVGDGNLLLQPQLPSGPDLMPCPACGRPLSPLADLCPDCGDNLALRRHRAWHAARNRRALCVVGLLIAIALLAYGVGMLFQGAAGTAMIIAAIALYLAYQIVRDR